MKDEKYETHKCNDEWKRIRMTYEDDEKKKNTEQIKTFYLIKY